MQQFWISRGMIDFEMNDRENEGIQYLLVRRRKDQLREKT
jgi:hypothetical protein